MNQETSHRIAVARGHRHRAGVSRVLACGVLAAITIDAARAATIHVIDEGPVAGQPSLAFDHEGLPVIAYRTLTNKLRVARCSDRDCADISRIEITGSYHTTEHFSLAITPAGNPGIAFQDNVERRLDVVRCVTVDCTGGGHEIFTIDPGPNDVGAYVDWDFGPDNRAAFVYRDFAAGRLQLARCTTPACSAVDIETLAGDGSLRSGEYASLAFGSRVDPFVSAHWENPTLADEPAGVHAFDCSALPCSDSVEMIHYLSDPVGVGQDMALAPNDLPMFSYLDHSNGTVLYARCHDADCSGSIARVVVDDGSFVIGFDDNTSIGVRPDGRPVIAYQRQSATVPSFTSLYVAECGDGTCADVDLVSIERSGDSLVTGIDADLAIDPDGAVAIAWFDQSALDIKLARCGLQGCEGPGDRLFADGFDAEP